MCHHCQNNATTAALPTTLSGSCCTQFEIPCSSPKWQMYNDVVVLFPVISLSCPIIQPWKGQIKVNQNFNVHCLNQMSKCAEMSCICPCSFSMICFFAPSLKANRWCDTIWKVMCLLNTINGKFMAKGRLFAPFSSTHLQNTLAVWLFRAFFLFFMTDNIYYSWNDWMWSSFHYYKCKKIRL